MPENIDRVEYYAGGCGQEKPLAVYRAGQRLLVVKILSEKRLFISLTGERKEYYECLLETGEVVKVEREW